MSGGPGSPIGAPLKAVGTGVNTARNAMDEQRRSQIAQMASQRILMKPTDAAGKKMYKEAMALRTANPGIIGAPGGSSFTLTPPVQGGGQQLGGMAGGMLNALSGVIGNRFRQSRGSAGSVPVQYTIPGAPPVARPQPGGPLDPNEILALQNMRRDAIAGTRTPAQLRLAELLGK